MHDEGKLHKMLLLLLCSNTPGEVMAARDALLRVAGIGPHEFAASLLNKNETVRYEPSHDHQKMAGEILNWYDGGGYLRPNEVGFVTDMLDWEFPSDKQLAWLEKIYVSMRRRSSNA
jgi:hypothetical protein